MSAPGAPKRSSRSTQRGGSSSEPAGVDARDEFVRPPLDTPNVVAQCRGCLDRAGSARYRPNGRP